MIRSVLEQNPRPFSELLFHCEFRAIASRVVSAVSNFFKQIAHLILEKCCQLENRAVTISDSKKNFIDHLLKIPMDQREAFVRQVFSIFSPKVDPDLQDTFIRAMAKKDGHRLVRSIRQYITFDMATSLNIKIIEIITEVPFRDRELFTDHLLKFMSQNIDYCEKGKIIDAIAEIPTSERQQLIKNASLFYPNQIWPEEKIVVIKNLMAVPEDQRDLLTHLALQVLSQETSRHFLKSVFESITAIPHHEREQVIEKAILLFGDEMGRSDKLMLIKSLANIPLDQRESVVTLALQVITPAMSYSYKQAIINAIIAAPLDQRESIVTLALRVITPRTYDFDSRDWIIKAITAIPHLERESVIANALLLITPEMYGRDACQMIELVAAQPANNRDNFVANRRRGIHHQNAIAVRQGVNVHEGNRDQQTKKAIELLYKHQKEPSQEEIKEAIHKFITYLRNSEIEPQKKQQAEDALLMPRREDEDFGPLIDEQKFSICGLLLSGKTLIARLWIFTSKLSGDEEKNNGERANARIGMIHALSDSYYFDGRVCNQGKTQRLVTAVLQGRLAGVNIEGEIIPEQMTKELAMRTFFSKRANREICNKDKLLEAADKFCKETPSVNREEFIQEINEYIKEQEIS